MRKYAGVFSLFIGLLLIPFKPKAQQVLVKYAFKNCGLTANQCNAGDLKNSVALNCDCGIEDEAVILNGQKIELPVTLDSFFRNDYSLCFSFLPGIFSGEMDLFSKAAQCNADTNLRISYRAKDSVFQFNVREGIDENIFLEAKADPGSCWQTICLSKNGIDFRVFVNGVEKDREIAPNLINLENKYPLTINGSACVPSNLVSASGKMDNIILANYGFNGPAVISMYKPQQKILTEDTLIFLGDQFLLRSESNCPGNINWMPTVSLDNPSIPGPLASPVVETRYQARFDISGCSITDNVLVRVVDKEKLQCAEIRFPSAFTPNQDGLNEGFGISNYYLIEKLFTFDILDRNGSIIFHTEDPEVKWDGTYKNKPLNPGSYYYRISYQCKGEKYQSKGALFLLK